MYKQYTDMSDWIVTAYFQEMLNADPKRAGRKEKNRFKKTKTNKKHQYTNKLF